MSLQKTYVASKDYPCGRECGEPIVKGTRYTYSSLPPWTEPLYAEQWRHIRLHGPHWEDCPRHATMLAKVERGEL